MQMSKLTLILIILLVIQSVALTVVVLRQSTLEIESSAEPRIPSIRAEATESGQVLKESLAIIEAASDRGTWTNDDSTRLWSSLDKMTREDQAKVLNAIGHVVNNQEFEAGTEVVLPFGESLSQ